MKLLLITFLSLSLVQSNALLQAQGSCGSPDGAFFVTTGNPTNYTIANGNGWCYNNLTAGQTYCWTYTLPSSGDLFIKIIRNGSCGNCDGSASLCASPGCVGGCFSFPISCTNTQYTPACAIQQAGGFEIGTGCTPAQVCGNVFTWCITIPAGCSTMDVCPMVSTTCAGVLPVELISFSTECQRGEAHLSWSTASETNNDYFTIERSEDAEHYTEIGRIKGAGTTSFVQHYSFTDDLESLSSENETVYYRLSQTDFDGTNKVYFPVSTNLDCNRGITVFPTLSDGEIFIHAAKKYPSAEISVHTLLGRTVYSERIPEDWKERKIDLENMPRGMYMVVILSEKESVVKKIVLK